MVELLNVSGLFLVHGLLWLLCFRYTSGSTHGKRCFSKMWVVAFGLRKFVEHISVKNYICYTCLVLSSGMHLRFNIDVDNCYATYCHLSSGLSLVEISVDFCFYFFGL